jgi:Leucine-rich repeat (LRR) protein
VLHVAHNKLRALPAELAACSQLLELVACHNSIHAIPEALSSLPALQSLRMDGNRVKLVPPALLSGCTSLRALALHDNPITADQLRSTAGFEDYQRRRRARCDKQLEASVLIDLDRSFTEGADQQQWRRWG